MKTAPSKPHETDEQQFDTPFDRIMNVVTPAPNTKTNPWSIEAQTLRDVQIVSMILQRYAQHRDLIALRGNRTIGIGELCDAMIDKADLCALFSGDQLAEQEQRRGCDCGCDRDEECEKFNKSLK